MDPYKIASDLYKEATETYQGLGDYASSITPVGQPAPQVGRTTVGDYGPDSIIGATVSGINDFINPYYEQVINQALGTIDRGLERDLNRVGASASAAGAFGGSRHGLVEAEAMERASRARGDLAAQLGAQGFNTALGASQAALAQELDRGRFLSGTQAQLDAGANIADAELALAGRGQDLTAAQFLTGVQERESRGLMDLASGYYSTGNDISDRMMRSGAAQQSLVQQIMDLAATDIDRFSASPYTSIDIINAALSGSPLNREVTQTNTQTYQPGLLDYLSLATQLGSAALGAER